MGGFSYRGKNIGDFGEIYYIPDAGERGEYALPYEVSEQEINGRDGAYYYGNRVEARQFDLKCYYEELTQQTKEDIMHWFGRNTKGRLIFDRRDYAYYNVIPNGRVEFQDYSGMTCHGLRYKGMMTIHLKAYCPFAMMLPSATVNDAPLVGYAIVGTSVLTKAILGADNETIVLKRIQMPDTNYDPEDDSFYIYNVGTEPAPLRIRLAGAATDDATITNETNGTVCVIHGMTKGNTTDVNKYVEIDAETGRVTLVGVLNTQLAFEMHDRGYIWLDPCTPFVRDIAVTYTSGSDTVTSDGQFTEEMVGQFIWLNDDWHQITAYTDSDTITIADDMGASGTKNTQIVTMNHIVLNGFDLDDIEMEFTPRLR